MTKKQQLELEAYKRAHEIIKGHYWDSANEGIKVALDILTDELGDVKESPSDGEK
jgi:hypothetical protein